MRMSICTLALLVGLLGLPLLEATGDAAAWSGAAVGSLQQPVQAAAQPEINVDIDRDSDAWYTNPLWIAIGVIALVAVIALIVSAARGGGTTVVRG